MTYYILRKIIRKLPGIVIRAVPKPEPTLTEGVGARAKAGEICRKAGYKSCLVVTDTTLFSLGFHEKIVQSLQDCGVRCTVFSEISSEPTTEIAEAGRAAAVGANADVILALGGGSVLDASKMIAAGIRKPKKSVRSLQKKFLLVRGGTVPMISVPSTAGTGAEITVGAIITDTAHGKKTATVVVGLNVTDVILDPELTLHAPAGVTAACGIDALSHGMEGLAADVRPDADDLAKSTECCRLVLSHLPRLLENPEDPEGRLAMCRAALYGGNAINKQLAGYVHAFAHTIGAVYHIPHGNAIALSLLPVMQAQLPACREKLAALCDVCEPESPAQDADAKANRLLDAIRCLTDKCGFADRGAFIPRGDYEKIASMVAADSINYSAPVTFRKREIFAILDAINGTTDEQ